MHKLLQDYFDIKTANVTGLSIEQVRTLNRLEQDHNRAEASEAIEHRWRIEPFEVEMDERLGLPRVSWLDSEHGHPYSAVVRSDGTLDYKL